MSWFSKLAKIGKYALIGLKVMNKLEADKRIHVKELKKINEVANTIVEAVKLVQEINQAAKEPK